MGRLSPLPSPQRDWRDKSWNHEIHPVNVLTFAAWNHCWGYNPRTNQLGEEKNIPDCPAFPLQSLPKPSGNRNKRSLSTMGSTHDMAWYKHRMDISCTNLMLVVNRLPEYISLFIFKMNKSLLLSATSEWTRSWKISHCLCSLKEKGKQKTYTTKKKKVNKFQAKCWKFLFWCLIWAVKF